MRYGIYDANPESKKPISSKEKLKWHIEGVFYWKQQIKRLESELRGAKEIEEFHSKKVDDFDIELFKPKES